MREVELFFSAEAPIEFRDGKKSMETNVLLQYNFPWLCLFSDLSPHTKQSCLLLIFLLDYTSLFHFKEILINSVSKSMKLCFIKCYISTVEVDFLRNPIDFLSQLLPKSEHECYRKEVISQFSGMMKVFLLSPALLFTELWSSSGWKSPLEIMYFLSSK